MDGVSLRSNSYLIFENNFGTFDFSLDQRYKVHNVLKKVEKSLIFITANWIHASNAFVFCKYFSKKIETFLELFSDSVIHVEEGVPRPAAALPIKQVSFSVCVLSPSFLFSSEVVTTSTTVRWWTTQQKWELWEH